MAGWGEPSPGADAARSIHLPREVGVVVPNERVQFVVGQAYSEGQKPGAHLLARQYAIAIAVEAFEHLRWRSA